MTDNEKLDASLSKVHARFPDVIATGITGANDGNTFQGYSLQHPSSGTAGDFIGTVRLWDDGYLEVAGSDDEIGRAHV